MDCARHGSADPMKGATVPNPFQELDQFRRAHAARGLIDVTVTIGCTDRRIPFPEGISRVLHWILRSPVRFPRSLHPDSSGASPRIPDPCHSPTARGVVASPALGGLTPKMGESFTQSGLVRIVRHILDRGQRRRYGDASSATSAGRVSGIAPEPRLRTSLRLRRGESWSLWERAQPGSIDFSLGAHHHE